MDIFQQSTSQSLYNPNETYNYQTQNIDSPIQIEDVLAQSVQENSVYNYSNITSYQNTEEYPVTGNINETYAINNIGDNINNPTYSTYANNSNNNIISSTEVYPTTNYEVTNNYEIQDISPLSNNNYYETTSPGMEYQNEAYDHGSYNIPNYSTMRTPVSTPQYEKFYSKIPLTKSSYKNDTNYVIKADSFSNSALKASGFYVFRPSEKGENPRRSLLTKSKIKVEPIRDDEVIAPKLQVGQHISTHPINNTQRSYAPQSQGHFVSNYPIYESDQVNNLTNTSKNLNNNLTSSKNNLTSGLNSNINSANSKLNSLKSGPSTYDKLKSGINKTLNKTETGIGNTLSLLKNTKNNTGNSANQGLNLIKSFY